MQVNKKKERMNTIYIYSFNLNYSFQMCIYKYLSKLILLT